MGFTVQFPDLTELRASDVGGEVSSWHTPIDPNSVTTQFAFAVTVGKCGITSGHTIEGLKKADYKIVSCANNWWPSHIDEKENRELQFWWKRFEKNTTSQTSNRTSWCNEDNMEGYASRYKIDSLRCRLAENGCGFALLKFPRKKPWIRREYFGLFRTALNPRPYQVHWLKANNYRLLDTGFMSQYWINGWPPEEFSFEKEKEFWKQHAIRPRLPKQIGKSSVEG